MDHSVLGFSHEMKVLIERSTEIAYRELSVVTKSDGSSPTYPPKFSDRSSTLSLQTAM